MDVLKKFFEDYAVVSMSGDAEKLSEYYAEHFIIASKDQSSVFNNDAQFIGWLKEVSKFNQKTGLLKMIVKNVSADEFGKHFHKASVTWAATFSSKPQEEIEFDIHYILSETEEGFKIVFYVSDDDQEALMKEKDVL